MTKIISHRGGAGIAFENSLSAFKLSKELGVEAIEFDVQRTKDGVFVVCHDNRLLRVTKANTSIDKISYKELQVIPLNNGEHIPLLKEVLAIAGNIPLIIEIKISGYTEEICRLVDTFPKLSVTYVSDKADVIAECRKFRPKVPALVIERHQPFTAIHTAKAIQATGLALNYKLLNPLLYWLCKRAGLQVMIYTVNNRFAVQLMRKLYPNLWICTNHPERFITPNPSQAHARII